MITKSTGSDAMVSSNTFGVDCISNLSDRSPDSDSERDSGSMMIVRFTEFQFDSNWLMAGRTAVAGQRINY